VIPRRREGLGPHLMSFFVDNDEDQRHSGGPDSTRAAFGNARSVPILKASLGPHFADTTLTTKKPRSGQFIAVHWDR
jgi:hypothetical protein